MEPGDLVSVVMTKWGERPHWEMSGYWLGSDEHGDWLGFPRSTWHHRPGYEFDSEVDSVTLLPREGWHVATLHDAGIWVDVYVDLSTPPVREGSVVGAVDLDLDVIRASTGATYLDDEDEFAEHRVEFGYPTDVVAAVEAEATRLLAAVGSRSAPFDGATAQRWLTTLRELDVPAVTRVS